MSKFLSTPTSRRDAFRIGGLTVTLGALAAACGQNRGGDDAPGRVGYAPPVEGLETYTVDDVVLLRTATSLELTAIEVYDRAMELGAIPSELTPYVEAMIENHRAIADRMAELTEAEGGEAWTCANPWFMDRLVEPVLAAIVSDTVEGEARSEEDVVADVLEFATALENLAAATHQDLVTSNSIVEARTAHAEAAATEARHGSVLAIHVYGSDAYISPALVGEDVPPSERGGIRQYAIPSTFGQTAQLEIKAGPPDENGVRTSFLLQTPAENSFVYAELEGCDA